MDVFDENDEPTETVKYNNGTAEFYIENNILNWNDKTEDAGLNMEFIKE